MKKLLTAIALTLAVSSQAVVPVQGNSIQGDAINTFIDSILAGDMVSASAIMSLEMQQVLDLSLHMAVPAGDMVHINRMDSFTLENMRIFDTVATHNWAEVTYRFIMDENGQIIGIQTLNFNSTPTPVAPNANYTAEPVVIGNQWPLAGMLTMPNTASSANPVPAVVLVHGSGSSNMDSVIFNNRPFHDIATYLSSNGVAVLRYDKRTLIHGAAVSLLYGADFTVWQESIEDALIAAQLLQEDPRVGDVFIVGLSLGAMLAPRIVEEGNLAGAVMLAGSPRPLYQVSYSQNHMAINSMLEEGLITQEQADETLIMVSALLEQARGMHEMTEDELRQTTIFGLPGLYQLSISNSLPLGFISRNDTPVLILHGDADFQVLTEEDFNVMVEYTYGMEHVTAILYDGLTHLFTPVKTDFVDLREYMVAGSVDVRVLRDIVEWVLGNSR